MYCTLGSSMYSSVVYSDHPGSLNWEKSWSLISPVISLISKHPHLGHRSPGSYSRSNPTKSSTEHKDCVVQSAEVPCYGGQAVVWQWKSCDAVEKVVAATGLPQPPPPDVRWVRRPDRKHCFHNLLHVFFIQLVLYFIEYCTMKSKTLGVKE